MEGIGKLNLALNIIASLARSPNSSSIKPDNIRIQPVTQAVSQQILSSQQISLSQFDRERQVVLKIHVYKESEIIKIGMRAKIIKKQ